MTAVSIRELREFQPELMLGHGKPRHPQSQGSFERGNSDTNDMWTAWMTDNQTTRLSVGPRFVQFMKNRAHNAAVKRSPYQVMFGVEPRAGLNSTSVPNDLVDLLQTEDDVSAFASAEDSAHDQTSALLEEHKGSNAAVIFYDLAIGGSMHIAMADQDQTTLEPSAADALTVIANKPDVITEIDPQAYSASDTNYTTASTAHIAETVHVFDREQYASASVSPLYFALL